MKPEQEQIRYGITPSVFTHFGPVVALFIGAAVARLLFVAFLWLLSVLH